jgi:ATP-dependent DNA ligase
VDAVVAEAFGLRVRRAVHSVPAPDRAIRQQGFGRRSLLGTRIGDVGGLLLALKSPDGAFHFAGKVGTGFTSAMRAKLGKLLDADHINTPPVLDAPRLKGARWSRLKHVAEVEFIEWTSASELRHPSFQGLRKDKTPDECVREDAAFGVSSRKRHPRSSDEA